MASQAICTIAPRVTAAVPSAEPSAPTDALKDARSTSRSTTRCILSSLIGSGYDRKRRLLTVIPGEFELGTDGPSVILVGVDESVTASRAAAYAAGLARRQGARVVAVYVETPEVVRPDRLGRARACWRPGRGAQRDRQGALRPRLRRAPPEARHLNDLRHGARRRVPRDCPHRAGDAGRRVVVGASLKAGHRLIGSLAVRLVRAGKWPVTAGPVTGDQRRRPAAPAAQARQVRLAGRRRPPAARQARPGRDAPVVGRWRGEAWTRRTRWTAHGARARDTWDLPRAGSAGRARASPPCGHEPRVYDVSVLGLLMLVREFPPEWRTALAGRRTTPAWRSSPSAWPTRRPTRRPPSPPPRVAVLARARPLGRHRPGRGQACWRSRSRPTCARSDAGLL